MMLSLAGRFLIAKIYDPVVLFPGVVIAALVEGVLRISLLLREACTNWMFRKKMQETEAVNESYKLYVSEVVVMSCLTEAIAIVVAPVLTMTFYYQRFYIDLGYAQGTPPTGILIGSMAFQLFLEIIVAACCCHFFHRKGFPVRRFKFNLKIFGQLALVLSISISVVVGGFNTMPAAGLCTSYDYCSCQYPLAEVHCAIGSNNFLEILSLLYFRKGVTLFHC